MKRMLCALLALALLAGFCACAHAAADDPVVFTPKLAPAMDYGVTEWMSTSRNRAMLTVLLCMDYIVAYDGDEANQPDLLQSSYIGVIGGNAIVLNTHSSNRDIMIMFMPSSGTAAYTLSDPYTDSVIEAGMQQSTGGNYYRNEIADIVSVAQDLQKALESN